MEGVQEGGGTTSNIVLRLVISVGRGSVSAGTPAPNENLH